MKQGIIHEKKRCEQCKNLYWKKHTCYKQKKEVCPIDADNTPTTEQVKQ